MSLAALRRVRQLSRHLTPGKCSGHYGSSTTRAWFNSNESTGSSSGRSRIGIAMSSLFTIAGGIAVFIGLDNDGRQAFAQQQSSSSEAPKVKESDLVDLSQFKKWDRNWDGRRYLERGKGSRYVILVRHGQYHIENKDDSQRTLTALGRRQATLLANHLVEHDFSPTRVVSSTMTRALETTTFLLQHPEYAAAEYVVDANLREGRPCQSIPARKRYLKTTVERDGKRINAAFKSYFHRAPAGQDEDTYDVVVCHANVIRYLVCAALQIPTEAWLRMSLPHCSVTILRIDPRGRVSLRCLGDSGFLPRDMVTR